MIMEIAYPNPYTKQIDDKNCKQKKLGSSYLFRLSHDIITQKESKKGVLLNWVDVVNTFVASICPNQTRQKGFWP